MHSYELQQAIFAVIITNAFFLASFIILFSFFDLYVSFKITCYTFNCSDLEKPLSTKCNIYA